MNMGRHNYTERSCLGTVLYNEQVLFQWFHTLYKTHRHDLFSLYVNLYFYLPSLNNIECKDNFFYHCKNTMHIFANTFFINMKNFLSGILFCVLALTGFAQDEYVDSLSRELAVADSDSAKIVIYGELFDYYYQYDSKS